MLIFLDRLPSPSRGLPDSSLRAQIGGKAAWLAWALGAGERVPPAAVLPVSHFDAATARADDGHLRLLPDEVATICTQARGLGPWLAVRSSAVDEDGARASHAGQFLSVVGVQAGPALAAAIEAVWQSALSSRVRAYRGGAPARMAVVIQALVPARSAGVLFTQDPHTGAAHELLIEASLGLGEAVVGGGSVPAFYRLSRPRRAAWGRVLRGRVRVIEATPGRQSAVHRLGAAGPVEDPLPAAQQEVSPLGPAALIALGRLGLRLEARAGCPLDLEWAEDEQGRLFLLQVRPITAQADLRRSGPVVWTRRFIGERWTEPATPYGWSVMRGLLEWFIAYPAASRRYLGGGEASRLVRFAPYFNVTVFRHLAFKLPGAAPPRFLVELLPPAEALAWARKPAAPPDLAVYAAIIGETIREERWRRFRWNPFTNAEAWAAFLPELDAALLPYEQPPVGIPAALSQIEALKGLARRYIGLHICSLLFANLWVELAEAALVAAGHEAAIPGLLRSPVPSPTALAHEALAQVHRGSLDLATFRARYGHRADSSWELSSERWAEASEASLRALAAAAAEAPIVDKPLPSVPAGLPGPLAALVRLAGRYLALREEQRSHFDRVLWRWKQALLVIEAALDLPARYLEEAELVALIEDRLPREEALLLVRRRAESIEEERRRRAAGDEPPDFFVGEEAVEQTESGPRLVGLGVSRGVVTGQVRILRALDPEALRPGEILVARATDPGWTPLFHRAGGLVTELGGMLSHGAVVARELGLPAVVNLPGATRLLRDGVVVTVDGGRGIVYLR